MLYKLDLFNQQSTENQSTKTDFSASIQAKLNDLDKKITSVHATTIGNTVKHHAEMPTYSSVVKSTVKPAVVIKPKEKQTSKKTFDEIVKNINTNDVRICSTRNARDGKVILRCENASGNQWRGIQQTVRNFGIIFTVERVSYFYPRTCKTMLQMLWLFS